MTFLDSFIEVCYSLAHRIRKQIHLTGFTIQCSLSICNDTFLFSGSLFTKIRQTLFHSRLEILFRCTSIVCSDTIARFIRFRQYSIHRTSLLHVPRSLAADDGIDPEVRPWLAFGQEKLVELSILARGAEEGRADLADALEESRHARASRRLS